MSQNSSIFPDPEFDGQKAWLLFLSSLFIHGGLTEKEAEAFNLREHFPDSFFELHTDEIHCFQCKQRLGSLIAGTMHLPIECFDCSKDYNNYYQMQQGLMEYQRYFKFKHGTRAYNYLLQYSKQIKGKGTWHNLNR